MKTHLPIPKRLFSIPESGVYIARGVYGVRTLVWNGELPIVRHGRKIFIDVKDLDSFIERNKITYSMRPEDQRPGNGKLNGKSF